MEIACAQLCAFGVDNCEDVRQIIFFINVSKKEQIRAIDDKRSNNQSESSIYPNHDTN